jgi:hypothetical protein
MRNSWDEHHKVSPDWNLDPGPHRSQPVSLQTMFKPIAEQLKTHSGPLQFNQSMFLLRFNQLIIFAQSTTSHDLINVVLMQAEHQYSPP